MQWSLSTCSTCMFILKEALGLEVTQFDAHDQLFSLFQVYPYRAKVAISYFVSSDRDMKSEELLWVGAGSTFIIHWYSFIVVHCFLAILTFYQFDQFFRQDMVEKIALQGRCWYQAMIKVTVFFFFFFKETSKNTGRDKIVKFVVYETLQSNKSFAK